MSDRFTASVDEKGDWLVFDTEDFYCCYGPTTEHDAISEMIKLNNNNTAQSEVSLLKSKITELEQERDKATNRHYALASHLQAIIKDSIGVAGYQLNNKVTEWDEFDLFIVESEKLLKQRDLEMQAKGAFELCNKALDEITLPEMSALRSEYFKAGITALAYAVEHKAKQLRNQARGDV